jgi:quinohemoprotein ethanol dehydrogenase
VKGVQYIAILAGTGGGGWNMWTPDKVAARRGNDNRILVFRLDGGATPIPPGLPPLAPIPAPVAAVGTAADAAAGAELFARNCGSCHANFERSPVPDLRRSTVISDAKAFENVVRGGALQKRGMPSWDDLLSEGEVEKIRASLVEQQRAAYEQQQKGSAPAPAAQAAKEGHL